MTAYYWTDERIIDAIRAFHAKHGRTPKAHEWDRTGPDHPERETVRTMFGSWNEGMRAAGFTPRKPHAPGWAPEDIIHAFLDFLAVEGRWPTADDLGQWRHGRGSRRDPRLPQWQTVRNHFGSITGAKLAAGWDPDAASRPEPRPLECAGCGCELDTYTTGCRTCGDRRRRRLLRQTTSFRDVDNARRRARSRRAKNGAALMAVETTTSPDATPVGGGRPRYSQAAAEAA